MLTKVSVRLSFQCTSAAALAAFALAPIASRALPPVLAAPRKPIRPGPVLPAPEPATATVDAAGPSPFSSKAVTPNATGQTLNAPITASANTSADGLTVNQAGAGRAITGSVTSTSNGLSAIKGITAGSGSGVNGVNSGAKGQAGKFEITNTSSNQASLLATTVGNGSVLQAVAKGSTSNSNAAVDGENDVNTGVGIGVSGSGGYAGVVGYSKSGGAGFGVYGYSSDGYGVYGDGGSGPGVYGSSFSAGGVYGSSTYASGVYAYSDQSYGLYAQSSSSYAGYFNGPVYSSGSMTAASYGYTSDRDQKQDFAAVDSADVLNRIAAMPITAWDYKTKPSERHIGPMAQDFRAAFGLGADEKHIDVVDGIGVSLAAIKELQRLLLQRNEQVVAQASQIGSLQAEVQALHQAVDTRFAALELAAVAAAAADSVAHP